MRHPYWARREIARLDPERDAARIAHLTFEVRYGLPLFVHPLFSVAFARQVAVPAIARTLYRDGTGLILDQTARRNDDTLVFFGLLFRHVGTAEGRAVVQRITRIHARFQIANELNLYTLVSLACLPRRIGEQFLGRDPFSERETVAMYGFWRQVGELMEIRDIPPSPDAMLRWMLDFEAAEYRLTRDGREVTLALAREFGERWFPAPLRNYGQRLYFALFDEPLRAAHGIEPPRAADVALLKLAVRAYFGAAQWLPDPGERSLVEQFGRSYGAARDIESIGPRP